MTKPSLNGGNGEIVKAGRRSDGRFAPGCPGGPGNPHSLRVNRLRTALMEAVDPQDISDVVASLITEAKAGGPSGVMAARELFDRTVGKAGPILSDDEGSGLSVEAQGVKLLLGMGLAYEHWPRQLLKLWRAGKIDDAPTPPGWVESREVASG